MCGGRGWWWGWGDRACRYVAIVMRAGRLLVAVCRCGVQRGRGVQQANSAAAPQAIGAPLTLLALVLCKVALPIVLIVVISILCDRKKQRLGNCTFARCCRGRRANAAMGKRQHQYMQNKPGGGSPGALMSQPPTRLPISNPLERVRQAGDGRKAMDREVYNAQNGSLEWFACTAAAKEGSELLPRGYRKVAPRRYQRAKGGVTLKTSIRNGNLHVHVTPCHLSW